MNKKIRVAKSIKILGIEIPLLAVFLLSAFAAVTVFTAVEQAAKGAELVYLEKKGAGLVNENKELSSELVMGSSLTKVSVEASVAGMVKPEKIMYLTGETQVVARLQ